MCVSKCPDKFATYTEMQLQHKLNKSNWEYYRQFCKPDFNNLDKVPKLIYVSHPLLRKHEQTVQELLLDFMGFDKLWLNKTSNAQHKLQYYNNVRVKWILFKIWTERILRHGQDL